MTAPFRRRPGERRPQGRRAGSTCYMQAAGAVNPSLTRPQLA